jgi:hypothetical protein
MHAILRPELTPEDFPDREALFQAEGGAVYTAERDGKFYIVQDGSTFRALFDDEDLAGLEPVKVFEFATVADRQQFIRDRGWPVRS